MPTITIPEGSTAVLVVTDKAGALLVQYEGVPDDDRDVALSEAIGALSDELTDVLVEEPEDDEPDDEEEEEDEPEPGKPG